MIIPGFRITPSRLLLLATPYCLAGYSGATVRRGGSTFHGILAWRSCLAIICRWTMLVKTRLYCHETTAVISMHRIDIQK